MEEELIPLFYSRTEKFWLREGPTLRRTIRLPVSSTIPQLAFGRLRVI